MPSATEVAAACRLAAAAIAAADLERRALLAEAGWEGPHRRRFDAGYAALASAGDALEQALAAAGAVAMRSAATP